jgi:hypothetical protein
LIERNGLSLTQLVEGRLGTSGLMKEVLTPVASRDETEPFVTHQSFDCAIHSCHPVSSVVLIVSISLYPLHRLPFRPFDECSRRVVSDDHDAQHALLPKECRTVVTSLNMKAASLAPARPVGGTVR